MKVTKTITVMLLVCAICSICGCRGLITGIAETDQIIDESDIIMNYYDDINDKEPASDEERIEDTLTVEMTTAEDDESEDQAGEEFDPGSIEWVGFDKHFNSFDEAKDYLDLFAFAARPIDADNFENYLSEDKTKGKITFTIEGQKVYVYAYKTPATVPPHAEGIVETSEFEVRGVTDSSATGEGLHNDSVEGMVYLTDSGTIATWYSNGANYYLYYPVQDVEEVKSRVQEIAVFF